MEVVASLSQGRTAAAQCGLFTYKSVPVIFEPPCITYTFTRRCLISEDRRLCSTRVSRFAYARKKNVATLRGFA